MHIIKLLISLLFFATLNSFGQAFIELKKEVAIENAKLFSIALCSHDTNKFLAGGDPKKLSFFNFSVAKPKSNSVSVQGFCNSIQDHPSTPRRKTLFNLKMRTIFPLNVTEGYDYGIIGSYKVRIRWTLENPNPILDPEWKSLVQVRYHTLELYRNLPLIELWSPLNPLKIDIQNLSIRQLKGIAFRNLRTITVEKNSSNIYHFNYTNFEEYYRNTHANREFAQGVGLDMSTGETAQVYGCIYSSYRGDGSIEILLDANKCRELYNKLKPE